jgi:uncharacterized protein (TIGR02300 family)
VVKLEWGTKRACQGCMTRFYDMRRTPVICPKCGDTYEIQTTGRRSRARSSALDDAASLPLDEDILNLPNAEAGLDDEEGLIEDASELGGDLDDMVDVIDPDHNDDN